MIAYVLGALLAQGRMPPLPATVPPVPPGAALIRNSGSTNSAGYTLVISPDGGATLRQYDGFTQKAVAAAQTRWLFARLAAAGPLDSLGTEHCMKSASFGTTTQITWNGVTSGDLSCSADPVSRELIRTIAVIATQLQISTQRRPHRLHLL